MNQSGALTKSVSAFTASKSQTPTYQRYAHFMKAATAVSSTSQFIRPPHMQDPQYVAARAAKPDTAMKSISLNDLEEGVKLTILSDIERDHFAVANHQKRTTRMLLQIKLLLKTSENLITSCLITL